MWHQGWNIKCTYSRKIIHFFYLGRSFKDIKIKLVNYLCTLDLFLCTQFYQKQPTFLFFWVLRELIHSLIYKIRLLALNNLWSWFVLLGLSYNFPYMHPIYPTFHNSLFYPFSYNTSDTCSHGNAHHCSSFHSRHHSWKKLGKLERRLCKAVGGSPNP